MFSSGQAAPAAAAAVCGLSWPDVLRFWGAGAFSAPVVALAAAAAAAAAAWQLSPAVPAAVAAVFDAAAWQLPPAAAAAAAAAQLPPAPAPLYGRC